MGNVNYKTLGMIASLSQRVSSPALKRLSVAYHTSQQDGTQGRKNPTVTAKPLGLDDAKLLMNKIATGLQQNRKFLGKEKALEQLGFAKIGSTFSREIEHLKLAEKKLKECQQERKKIANNIFIAQQKLKAVQAELLRTCRGEDRYLELIVKEHELIGKEQHLMNDYKLAGENDNQVMDQLSQNLHTVINNERLQQFRTPYWVILGVFGGFLCGVFGTILLGNSN